MSDKLLFVLQAAALYIYGNLASEMVSRPSSKVRVCGQNRGTKLAFAGPLLNSGKRPPLVLSHGPNSLRDSTHPAKSAQEKKTGEHISAPR
jgi:hypothetical protein